MNLTENKLQCLLCFTTLFIFTLLSFQKLFEANQHFTFKINFYLIPYSVGSKECYRRQL